jgi:hypothetical protein
MSDLVDELNAEAARITQYTNRGGDGLLHAAADRIEELERELADARDVMIYMIERGAPYLPKHKPFVDDAIDAARKP